MRLTRVASLAAIFTLAIGACAQAQDLPEGPGKAALQSACTQCHGIDVIVRQPRGREEWTEVLARMIGAGAQLSDEDYNLVVEYLATHVGPSSQNAPAKVHQSAAAPGEKRDR